MRDTDAVATLTLWEDGFEGTSYYPEVLGARDLDGDGTADLLVSSPFARVRGVPYVGAVGLFAGPVLGELDTSDAVTVIEAEAREAIFGESLASVGDLDGDGFDDLAIGATYGEGPAQGGEVTVWLGPLPPGQLTLEAADGRVVGEVNLGYLGYDVDAGDFDGDGRPELVVAEPRTARVFVHADPTGGQLAEADALATIEAASDVWTSEVAVLDHDADGQPELALGGARSDGGTVWVARGALAGTLAVESLDAIEADADYGWFGVTVDAVGDVDGDGREDLAVGASHASAGSYAGGAFAVFTSLPDGAPLDAGDAALLAWGGEAYTYLGWSIAGGEDVTGDGTDDLAAGMGLFVFAGNGW